MKTVVTVHVSEKRKEFRKKNLARSPWKQSKRRTEQRVYVKKPSMMYQTKLQQLNMQEYKEDVSDGGSEEEEEEKDGDGGDDGEEEEAGWRRRDLKSLQRRKSTGQTRAGHDGKANRPEKGAARSRHQRIHGPQHRVPFRAPELGPPSCRLYTGTVNRSGSRLPDFPHRARQLN